MGFTYDIKPKIPYGYYCSKCKVKGIRLWRDINGKLYCLECGVEYQRKYHEEFWVPEYGNADTGVRIGWLVPAIPLITGGCTIRWSLYREQGMRVRLEQYR